MPELLPPDPERSATYWLQPEAGPPQFARWRPDIRMWRSDGWFMPISATTAAAHYTLASPIPIPDPEGLEAIRAVVAFFNDHVDARETGRHGPYPPDTGMWNLGADDLTVGQIRAAARALGL